MPKTKAATAVACSGCREVKPIWKDGRCFACLKTTLDAGTMQKVKSEHMRKLATERREPTMEELDQMIAEQSLCLPDWWDAETRRLREGQSE